VIEKYIMISTNRAKVLTQPISQVVRGCPAFVMDGTGNSTSRKNTNFDGRAYAGPAPGTGSNKDPSFRRVSQHMFPGILVSDGLISGHLFGFTALIVQGLSFSVWVLGFRVR